MTIEPEADQREYLQYLADLPTAVIGIILERLSLLLLDEEYRSEVASVTMGIQQSLLLFYDHQRYPLRYMR